MTPQAAAALRCPVCGGALMPLGTSLRCPQGHSYDIAKEGYVNLLAIQKRHAADPGDGKAMVRARRAFLQAGYYAPVSYKHFRVHGTKDYLVFRLLFPKKRQETGKYRHIESGESQPEI